MMGILPRLARIGLLCCATLGANAAIAADGPGADEGCTDAAGRPVRTVEDPLLPVLAKAAIERGERVLRVNTNVMRNLSSRAQLFFYAHECARHALAYSLNAAPTPERAHRADCRALATVQASGALGEGGAAGLQAELKFSADEWRLLPGPARDIDFSGCQERGVLRVPAGGPPSPARQVSNRCVHACGDRLWHCQKRCAEPGCRAGCQAAYDNCESRCPVP